MLGNDEEYPLKQSQQHSPVRTRPRSPVLPPANYKIAVSPSLLTRPPALNAGSRAGTTGSNGSTSVSRLFNLNDVLRGTPELEAETYLLRAVEKISGQAHQRTNTETARLFNTIAADDLTSAHLSINNCTARNNKDEFSYSPSPARARANTAPTMTAANVGVSTKSFATAPPPVPVPTQSPVAAAATKPPTGAGKARFKSLVNMIVQEKDSSVEQTLFGLSTALTELNKASKHHKKTSSNEVDDNEEFDSPLSSADKLAQTVEDAIKDKTQEDVETGGPPKATSTTDTPSDGCESEPDSPTGTSSSDKKKRKNKKRTKGVQLLNTASDGLKADWELFNEFLGGNKAKIKSYARYVICFIMVPSLVLAALLFHFVDDPKKDENGKVIPGQPATPSWWLLFIGVRQVVTFTMAFVTQALIIDYLALGSRFSLQWFGPVVTLLVVQSKGWPFISIFWGVYNLILLSGNKRYVRHWGYWQHWYGLFNEDNPGGHVINNSWNYTVLRLMIIIGIAVSVKRLIVGLMLGRRTFAHFGQQLAEVMKNMVLVGEVATLSREIETERRTYNMIISRMDSSMAPSVASGLSGGWAPNTVTDFVAKEADAAKAAEEDEARLRASAKNAADAAKTFVQARNAPAPQLAGLPDRQTSMGDNNEPTEDFTASEQIAIAELLDSWEEPTRAEEEQQKNITIGAVMQFRQALTFMKKKYPFLHAFGPADTRERCIESAQLVYDRLLMRTPHLNVLPFETLALLAKDEKGGIDQTKARQLIKVFRPERDGTLAKLDFVKSIDAVYKQLRLLSANVSNSSQIDRAVESLVNVVFYIILGCYVLSELGEDPLTLFFSFSSVILGFAFMFGASSAKFFDGVLFILVQRPYGVGDRIHLSNPQNDTSPGGSSGWVVEKVTLTTTTLYWGTTNERATISNGAVSNLRVINAARSPNATIFVQLKFGIDTPYEKIAVFKAAVEQFLKDRPREWLSFVGFRPTSVEVDQGFIGYKVLAQHRAGWQLIGQLLTSKAELTTYCLEVAKQLEMRYTSPPLPVDLKMSGTAASALRALGAGSDGKLDQKRITDALRANSSRRMHSAFQEGVDE